MANGDKVSGLEMEDQIVRKLSLMFAVVWATHL
jgi:hypothetical protein